MYLKELLERHTHGQLATPADDAEALRFFHQATLAGRGVQFTYALAPDFASFHQLQSQNHLVFLFRKKSGEVGGLATLSIRPAWISGRQRTVGYFSDMRMAWDRQVIRDWRFVLQQLLLPDNNLEELAGCRHFYCAVMADNQIALNAFTGRGRAPGFVPYADYSITHILGRKPLRGRASDSKQVGLRYAQSSDLPALSAFLDEAERGKTFGHCFAASELAYRLERWPGLRAESFLLAVTSSSTGAEAIVGCVAPWSPSPIKQTIFNGGPNYLRLLTRAMRTMRLPGHKHLPMDGEALKILTLTHLTLSQALAEAAREEVFSRMLARIYQDFIAAKDAPWQLLAFADFAPVTTAKLLRPYFIHTIGAKLLCASAEPAPFVEATHAFEMALV